MNHYSCIYSNVVGIDFKENKIVNTVLTHINNTKYLRDQPWVIFTLRLSYLEQLMF